ncbi:hypothetical protein, partial [Bacteroides thetaiotaomicron]
MSRTLPFRRVRVVVATVIAGVILTACGSGSEDVASDATDAITTDATGTGEAPVRDSGLPFDAMPEVPEGKNGFVECPY